MWEYQYYDSNDYLAHHGILGMKWGVRRYQNYDGTLTTAGMARYRDAESAYDSADRKYAHNKTFNRYGVVSNKRLKNSKDERNNAKVALSKEYDDLVKGYREDRRKELAEREKLYVNSDGTKMNVLQRHKVNLIEDYKHRGYSQAAAETAAKQRMKTEAIVAAVATVAAAVVIKKVGTRIGQDYCDKIIGKNTLLQNIGPKREGDLAKGALYVATNKGDRDTYGSLFPNEKIGLMRRAEIEEGIKYEGIYKNYFHPNNDIKRASINNARKILNEELRKDPDYKKRVISAMKNTAYGNNVEAIIDNNPKLFYDRFNQALATPQFQRNGINTQFYSALEKKGYNAILDINDARYSGYHKIATDPTIVFGNHAVGQNGLSTPTTEITEDDAVKNAMKYATKMILKNSAKEVGAIGAAAAVGSNYMDTKLVENYLNEHPNSELSKKEILKMLKKKT